MGCGQLVFELYRRVGGLRPGDCLQLTAEDTGAVTDVPAWCRMTGHELISADHPIYVIERKKD
jgi:tRNA 2-thiouridine synthesizing protein A